MLSNYFKFFAKLFGANSNMVDDLFEAGVLDLYIRILGFPLLVFMEQNTVTRTL